MNRVALILSAALLASRSECEAASETYRIQMLYVRFTCLDERSYRSLLEVVRSVHPHVARRMESFPFSPEDVERYVTEHRARLEQVVRARLAGGDGKEDQQALQRAVYAQARREFASVKMLQEIGGLAVVDDVTPSRAFGKLKAAEEAQRKRRESEGAGTQAEARVCVEHPNEGPVVLWCVERATAEQMKALSHKGVSFKNALSVIERLMGGRSPSFMRGAPFESDEGGGAALIRVQKEEDRVAEK